jgi:hypothetical protein
MPRLYPTPEEQLTDGAGRPYFLWDCEMTLREFEAKLRSAARPTRAYLVGKLMRQAKPDDVFRFVKTSEILDLWPELLRYLGRKRAFWTWLLEYWGHDLPAPE